MKGTTSALAATLIVVSVPLPSRGEIAVSPLARQEPDPSLRRDAHRRACCHITMIDVASRTVTAVDRTAGRAFRFELPDRAALAALEVGQPLSADYVSNRVSLDGIADCCVLIPNLFPRFESRCGGDCVKDRWTGYIWESTPIPTAQSRSQAVSHCSSINSLHPPAGLTTDERARDRGWGMPYIWELATLPDPTLPNSVVPPNLFFNIQQAPYWALGGTTGGDLKYLARVFGTPSGGVGLVRAQSVNLMVWCVLSPWTTGTVVLPPQ